MARTPREPDFNGFSIAKKEKLQWQQQTRNSTDDGAYLVALPNVLVGTTLPTYLFNQLYKPCELLFVLRAYEVYVTRYSCNNFTIKDQGRDR